MVLIPPSLDAGPKAIAGRFEEIDASLKRIDTALSRLIPLVEQSRLEAANLEASVTAAPKTYADATVYRMGAFEPIATLTLAPPAWATRCILTVSGAVAFSTTQFATSPQSEMRLECGALASISIPTLFAPSDGRMAAALSTSWSLTRPTFIGASWDPFTIQLTAKGTIGVTAGPCRLAVMPIWLSGSEKAL